MIGDNIKKYRGLRHLTQKQLAEMSGVSLSTITKLESGVLNNPSSGLLARIAIVLYVNCSDLESHEEFERSPFHLIDDDGIKHLEERGFTVENWSPHNSRALFSEEDWLLDIILGKADELTDEARYMVIGYEDNLLLMSEKYRRNKKKYTKED